MLVSCIAATVHAGHRSRTPTQDHAASTSKQARAVRVTKFTASMDTTRPQWTSPSLDPSSTRTARLERPGSAASCTSDNCHNGSLSTAHSDLSAQQIARSQSRMSKISFQQDASHTSRGRTPSIGGGNRNSIEQLPWMLQPERRKSLGGASDVLSHRQSLTRERSTSVAGPQTSVEPTSSTAFLRRDSYPEIREEHEEQHQYLRWAASDSLLEHTLWRQCQLRDSSSSPGPSERASENGTANDGCVCQ